jgi:Tol biopolymer transport system component
MLSDPLEILALDPDDKSIQRVVNGISVGARISVDGKRIAVLRRDTTAVASAMPDLYVTDVAGKEEPIKIVEGIGWALHWSRDGSELLVMTLPTGGERQLWQIAADNSQRKQLPINLAMEVILDCSPDGNWLLTSPIGKSAEHQVYLMHPDGTEKRALLASRNPVPVLGGFLMGGRFSPDGRQVYFVHHIQEEFVDPPPIKSSAIMVVDVDGGRIRRVLERTKGDHIYDARLSPDGKMFAVLIYDGPNQASLTVTMTHLEILDTDGRLIQKIRLPQWSTIRQLIDWR